MSKAIWHKGPPPSCGWWPASWCKDVSAYRWWSGKAWSLSARPDEGAALAGYSAAITSHYQSEIRWRNRPKSWPARSRT